VASVHSPPVAAPPTSVPTADEGSWSGFDTAPGTTAPSVPSTQKPDTDATLAQGVGTLPSSASGAGDGGVASTAAVGDEWSGFESTPQEDSTNKPGSAQPSAEAVRDEGPFPAATSHQWSGFEEAVGHHADSPPPVAATASPAPSPGQRQDLDNDDNMHTSVSVSTERSACAEPRSVSETAPALESIEPESAAPCASQVHSTELHASAGSITAGSQPMREETTSSKQSDEVTEQRAPAQGVEAPVADEADTQRVEVEATSGSSAPAPVDDPFAALASAVAPQVALPALGLTEQQSGEESTAGIGLPSESTLLQDSQFDPTTVAGLIGLERFQEAQCMQHQQEVGCRGANSPPPPPTLHALECDGFGLRAAGA